MRALAALCLSLLLAACAAPLPTRDAPAQAQESASERAQRIRAQM